MNQNIERYNPNINEGLNDKQIQKRIEEKQVNYDTSVPTKSIKRILYENFFTLFNILNLILAILVFSVGSHKNMLFLLIVIINTAISTIQEIHSKRVIDKLSLMAESKAKVIRNSRKQEISIHKLVLDDIIELNSGNQVVTDSIIQSGEVLVNESFITGEPDSISKKAGDMILSGSYIVSGKCIAKVEHIGEDNYTSKISSGSKYVKKINSEIMTSLSQIIKFLTFAIIPIGGALFYSQLHLQGANYHDAVIQTVAGIIGMIPEGLVLLTSTVLAVSVIRLSKSKVLVQELYCIETLARVDTLCLDKTGTLTEGSMEVKDFIAINESKNEMLNILSNIAKVSEDENGTIQAIKSYFTNITSKFNVTNKIAFSSQTKWSGFSFENLGSYIIGAPEFVLKENYDNYKNIISKYTSNYRVLVLAHSPNDFNGKNLPTNVELIGLVLILDKIRKEAANTLGYFYKQGVDIKIISGDNPITVSKIAKQVGITKYDSYIDMSAINENEPLNEIVSKYTIFGRVSPTQKKDLITALKANGKTVAMTGDGVNDVLALKESDCSIAMANGSDATKNISQLVLLDSNFASMPKVVAEGRRTINNIQRSASLFLVKTIYSCTLAVLFLFISQEYPFIPVQLSLISTACIGIPSFLLALEPNKERIKGNFLRNVISKALPTSITVIMNILYLTLLNKHNMIPIDYYHSLCVISTGICGLILLFTLALKRKNEKTRLPFSMYRLTLAILMVLLFFLQLHFLGWFYNIVPLCLIWKQIVRIIIVSVVNFMVLNFVFRKILKVTK